MTQPCLIIYRQQFFYMLLLFWCLVAAGCSNDREGELVDHWIACQKSETGKWVSVDSASTRFGIVRESRYQVSFANQRVVSSIGYALLNCTVYDRNNWTCDDINGLRKVVRGGEGPIDCGGELCFHHVNLFNRSVILLRGVKEAERLCGLFSEQFEREFESRRRFQR